MPRYGKTGHVVESRSDIPLQISLATNSCNGRGKVDVSDLYIGLDENNNDGNPYMNEFVIPFFKKNENILIPFVKDWLYLRLYHDDLRTEELQEILIVAGDDMVEKGIAEKYLSPVYRNQ